MKRLAPELDQVAQLIGDATARIEATTGELHAVLNRIGGFAELIRNLARQSKLLGLNATIEAARIGDAGRGFGIVAGEMKSLADLAGRTAADIDTCLVEAMTIARGNREAVTALHDAIGKGLVFAHHFAELAAEKDVVSPPAQDNDPVSTPEVAGRTGAPE